MCKANGCSSTNSTAVASAVAAVKQQPDDFLFAAFRFFFVSIRLLIIFFRCGFVYLFIFVSIGVNKFFGV